MNAHETKWTFGAVWIIVGFVFTMVFANITTEKEKTSGRGIYNYENEEDFYVYFLLQMACFVLGPLSFLSIIALKKRLEKIPDLPNGRIVGCAFSQYAIYADWNFFQ